MNRRDIIIVAVIINAGLLVTLFVSSLKKEGEPMVAQQMELPKVEAMVPQKKGEKEIDQMISKYTAIAKAPEKKEKVLPAPILTPKAKVEEKEKVLAPRKSPTRAVTVEKGDVLEKIARIHGVSVDEIMKLNKLKNSRLQIGQELKLPQRMAPKKVKEEGGKYYIVKGGDNPWTIAKKNGIKVEELLRLNNMDEEKAKRLRPGDRLRIK